MNIEKRFYEILGIRVFRKLVMLFEKFRHRKDKLHNINYHPQNMSMSSIRSFSGYLLYNVSCHVCSLIFVLLYFIIVRIVGAQYIVIDILMIMLSVFNCYCIMLQRYTFIKMDAVIKKRKNRRDKDVLRGIDEYSERIKNEPADTIKKEHELVLRLNEAVHKGENCFISVEDGELLRRIASHYYGDVEKKQREKPVNTINADLTNQRICDVSVRQRVIGNSEIIAGKLQELFRMNREQNVLYDFCVITENDDCEEAYRMLFINESRDEVEFITEVLQGAYSKRLSLI